MAGKEIKIEDIFNDEKREAVKNTILEHKMKAFSTGIEYLSIPDIRNKLSPITNMIALFERGEFAYIKNKGLDEVKKSINYLTQREVYENIK